MKTFTVLEPKDIDMQDPLNSGLAVLFLIESMIVFSPATKARIQSEPDKINQEIVARMRNGLSRMGYTITKIEDVPEVFKEE